MYASFSTEICNVKHIIQQFKTGDNNSTSLRYVHLRTSESFSCRIAKGRNGNMLHLIFTPVSAPARRPSFTFAKMTISNFSNSLQTSIYL